MYLPEKCLPHAVSHEFAIDMTHGNGSHDKASNVECVVRKVVCDSAANVEPIVGATVETDNS